MRQQERKRRYGSWISTFNELPLKTDSKEGKVDDDDDDVYVTRVGYFYCKRLS